MKTRASLVPRICGDKVTFEGDEHSLVIDGCGGRVTEYALRGKNVLHCDRDYARSGSTFWVAPQEDWPSDWPPPHAIDRAPFDIAVEDDAAVLTGPLCPELRVRIIKRFFMARNGDVDIVYTLDAIGAETCWAPWEVTRLPVGLCCFATGPTRIPQPRFGFARPIAPTVGPQEITWAPWRGQAGGYGTLVSDAGGWAAWAGHELLLVKWFPRVAARDFPPQGGVVKIWWEGASYLELEQMGPYALVQPGHPRHYRVVWRLAAIPCGIHIDAGSAALTRLLPAAEPARAAI